MTLLASSKPAACSFRFASRELDICRGFAVQAEVGGRSSIRSRAERMSEISVDQFVGQLGTLALAKWLKGRFEGHTEYARGRVIANRNPNAGDGGSDVIGTNIDVKTSLCRYPSMSLVEYNLLVRPREFYPDWVYVLGLCQADLESPVEEWQEATVHLMGWVSSEQLPEPGTDERFGDARVVKAHALHPLPPFRWEF